MDYKFGLFFMSDFVQQEGSHSNFMNEENWIILSSIEQSIKRKIEAIGTPLKDWDIQINYGIKTGYNDAFIIDTNKRSELLANCQTEEERLRTDELIRPILRGRDIKRYDYIWADLWIIYIPWHFPYQFDESIKGASIEAEMAFKSQYPSVYNHMLQYKDTLANRNKAETGIRYEWYALQRWGANYWEDFSKPKIIWKIIGNRMGFAIDNNSMYVNNACYILTSLDDDLEYIVAMLNSNPMLWYSYITNMNKTGVGDVQVGAQNINILPMPKAHPLRAQLEQEVKRFVQESEEDSKHIEKIVYDIFNLSDEERRFLDSFSVSIYE